MAVRGSASIDTGRFPNKDKQIQDKLSRSFPRILNTRIDMKKVVLKALKPWIEQQISSVLGFEDDVVVNLVYNLLETQQFPDGRAICVELMGFLDVDTMSFMEELWTHLVDASGNEMGISSKIMENAAKKRDMKRNRVQNAERFKIKQEMETSGNIRYETKEYRNRLSRHSRGARARDYREKPQGFDRPRFSEKDEYGPRSDERDEYLDHSDGRERRHSRRHRRHRSRERSHSPPIKEHVKEEGLNSMNSIWPPSPSPPAILSTYQPQRSPSPPKEIKVKMESESPEKERPRSILKKSKRRRSSRSRSSSLDRSYKKRKRRRRSYSRSPSRSRSRSTSRGRWNA